MKKKVLPVILMFIVNNCFTQNIYQSSSIPPSLLTNSHSVKREEKIVFEVRSIDDAVLNVHQVFTVLDEAGEDELVFEEYADEFRDLRDAEIKVFDANGKQLNKYKKREMISQAVGEGLVVNAKVYYFRVTAQSFPFTVQYDYEIKYNGTLNYPDFEIQTPGEAVESSSFIAKVPADIDLRFKPKNIQLNPLITIEGKNKIYDWEVKNLLPIKYEEGAANRNRYPKILLSPNKFSLDRKEGDLTSWKNFGSWLNDLYAGLDELPEERINFFRTLVKGAKDDEQKAKILYDYLQKNFRYISISLGIGGLKPFPADFTDKKKYGDCKALSNFMKAALSAVGVTSYLAIINSNYNSEPVDPAFPDNGFDHVILCIPQPKDSIWLECTSNKTDFNILSSFTENRNALLVTKNGGVLVPTPKSKASENKFITTSSVDIEDDASGKLNASMLATGEFKEMLMDVVSEKDDEKKLFLVNYLGYKQPENYTIEKMDDTSFKINIKLELAKIPEFQAGSKMFIAPRSYKLTKAVLTQKDARRLDYYFTCPYEKTDTTIYHLPEGYTVEALPKPRNILLDLYSFKTSYNFNQQQNIIITTASLILKQNRIPASKYTEAQKFFEEVNHEYSDKIVIKKQ